MAAEVQSGDDLRPRASTRHGRRGPRHAGRTVAQVFARDIREPEGSPLFFLARGDAPRVRPDANAGYLVCPIGGCDDPRLIVRGGSKRDHFAHKPGAGGHGPETLAHHTSKHLIAAWLRTRYPDAEVYPDTQEIENGQRPDVLLRFADGRQVAYEVQFAAMTADAWQVRHDKYVLAEVRDVWLFGGPRYDRRPRSQYCADDDIEVPPVFDRVLASDHPMLLIRPIEEQVSYARGPLITKWLTAGGVCPPETGDRIAQEAPPVHIHEADCTGGVIDLPGLRDLMKNAKGARPAWLAQCAAEAEAGALRAERRRLADEQHAQRAAAHFEWLAEFERRSARWAPKRAEIERTLGRTLPNIVDSGPFLTEGAVTTAAPDEWRWAVILDLLQNYGFTVDPDGLVANLPLQANVTRASAKALLSEYLVLLRQAGYIWFWGLKGPSPEEAISVVARLDEKEPSPPPRTALSTRQRQVRGPAPSGARLLAHARTRHAREVGPDALKSAWHHAVAERRSRDLATINERRRTVDPVHFEPRIPPTPRPSQARQLSPSHQGPVLDLGAPPQQDLCHFLAGNPAFGPWSEQQDWGNWGQLPERLHELAKITVYRACELSISGPTQTIMPGGCTDDDFAQVLEAIRAAGHISLEEFAPGRTRWRSQRRAVPQSEVFAQVDPTPT